MTPQDHAVIYRACNLCEAICGLEIIVRDNKVISIKGDRDDPFSKGHICPNAPAIFVKLFTDWKLSSGIKKVGDHWVKISWQEAFGMAADKLWEVAGKFGHDAVGV